MPIRLLSFFLSTSLVAANLSAQEVKPATDPHAAHAAHGSVPGLKKELYEGITEVDFMKLGDKPKTVKVVLIATFSDDNHGMNFNGYSKGAATWFVPVGWTVEVEFINPSPVPHSAIVIEQADTKKLQVTEPWFEGGAVEKHIQGIAVSKAKFTFTADEEGEYAFACGFPAHAIAGHWVGLEVTAEGTKPMLKLGDAEAKEIK